jgi:uncharacterized protein (DUF2147 family)
MKKERTMGKKIIATLVFILLLGGFANAQDEIVGTWLNQNKDAHIRIFKATNGHYYGKIEWLRDNPDAMDTKNPDESKRKAPVLGLMILKGFLFDKEKEQWNGGTIYDPDNGKTYDCYMWFGDGTKQLIIKGYVLGMKFMGRETLWTRVPQ